MLSIDEFSNITSSSTYPLLDLFILVTNADIQRRKKRSELGFMDRDKINGILNGDLLLIFVITLAD